MIELGTKQLLFAHGNGSTSTAVPVLLKYYCCRRYLALRNRARRCGQRDKSCWKQVLHPLFQRKPFFRLPSRGTPCHLAPLWPPCPCGPGSTQPQAQSLQFIGRCQGITILMFLPTCKRPLHLDTCCSVAGTRSTNLGAKLMHPAEVRDSSITGK